MSIPQTAATAIGNQFFPIDEVDFGAILQKQLSELGRVNFSIAAEGGNAIVVTCQAVDKYGSDMAVVTPIEFYLSDDSGGDGLTATAPSTPTAIATDGAIISETVAEKDFNCNTEADGDIAFTITEAGGPTTWYLVARIPGVGLSVSGAITFAA